MARPREKTKFWKPKAIILLPSTYQDGDSYPDRNRKKELEKDGYGTCEFKDGLDRKWTRAQLAAEVIRKYRHRDLLEETGVEFAKVAPNGSKKISVHEFAPDETVADLEARHGNGILVIMQKPMKVNSSTGHATALKSTIDVQKELNYLKQTGGIKIAHLNCQSLGNKIDEVRLLLLCRTDIDVMTLSETWLKPKDSDVDFGIPGYLMLARRDGVRNNEDHARGGVLIYVKDSLARFAKECPTILEKGLEAVCVELELGARTGGEKQKDGEGKQKVEGKTGGCVKRQVLRVMNVYVPPSTREQIAQFKKLKNSLNILKDSEESCRATHNSENKNSSSGSNGSNSKSSKGGGEPESQMMDKVARCKNKSCKCTVKYVILGDLNCDLRPSVHLRDMRSTEEEKIQTLNDFEKDNGLTQLITDFTRVRSRKERGRDTYIETESRIDLIYTDDHASILSAGVIHISLSDHYMVYCSWDASKERKPEGKSLSQTEDESFRHFIWQVQKVQTDIDVIAYKLILERDSANANRKWSEYERLRGEIERVKRENRKGRRKQKLKQKPNAVLMAEA